MTHVRKTRLILSLTALTGLLAAAAGWAWYGFDGAQVCQTVSSEKERWTELSLGLEGRERIAEDHLQDRLARETSFLWSRFRHRSDEEQRQVLDRTFREAGLVLAEAHPEPEPLAPARSALNGLEAYSPRAEDVFVRRSWRLVLVPSEPDGDVVERWRQWITGRQRWADAALFARSVRAQDSGRIEAELVFGSLRERKLPQRERGPILRETSLETWLGRRHSLWWVPERISGATCVRQRLAEVRRLANAVERQLTLLTQADLMGWLEEAERQILAFDVEASESRPMVVVDSKGL